MPAGIGGFGWRAISVDQLPLAHYCQGSEFMADGPVTPLDLDNGLFENSMYEMWHAERMAEIIRPDVSRLQSAARTAGRILTGRASLRHFWQATLDNSHVNPVLTADDSLHRYLDTSQPMALDEQLVATGTFWRGLTMQQPDISPNNDQRQSLQAALDFESGWRVVPTPMLNSYGRMTLALIAKHRMLLHNLDPDAPVLALPGEQPFADILYRLPSSYDHHWWARKPEILGGGQPKDAHIKEQLVIANRVPRSDMPIKQAVVTRADMIHWLQWGDRSRYEKRQAGNLVCDSGIDWTYPVIDVSPNPPPTPATAGELHELSSPYAFPETLLAIDLMHQLTGYDASNTNPRRAQPSRVVFSNEGIYRVRPGEVPELQFVVGVGNIAVQGKNGITRALSLQPWHHQRQDDELFRIRPSFNETYNGMRRDIAL
jgi:hypothetical protein